MLKNFINLWDPIKAVINASNKKAFKNKDILLSINDIRYLKQVLDILSIFVYTTTKLQAEKYPTIYYIIPEVFKIYNKLEKFLDIYKVSLFIFNLFINI